MRAARLSPPHPRIAVPIPPLHLVTDDAVLARPDFARIARLVLAAGAGRVALHLRGPGTGGRRMFELACALVPAAEAAGALLLVNDRVDVALAAGAGGVQVGARGLPPEDVRRMIGPAHVLGVSVHGREEAERAVVAAPSLLLVGTLYDTASHPGRVGAGADLVASLRNLDVPLVGIGGITPARVAEVRAAGAVGVAVLRGVWDADDAGRAVGDYLDAWGRASQPDEA